jgi:uncharacterized surface protein with fasciclin (FAS1) repeats
MADLVETAVSAGQFRTLVTAVQAANLAGALKGPGPFTVFAPNDQAFAQLPSGTVEALLKDPAGLAKVLTYHVVSGRVHAADVLRMTEGGKKIPVETLNGAKLEVSSEGLIRKKVHVNGAEVIAADIEASNGLIHVVNHVLLPP